MAGRGLFLLAVIVAVGVAVGGMGCGNDSSVVPDLAVGPPPGSDLAVASLDAASCGGTFNGFSPGAPLTFFDCGCGCAIDSFMHADVSPFWALSRTGMSLPVGTAGGLQTILETTPSSPVSVVGLLSQTLLGGFYLDGDFDLLVDYSFAGMTPPGEAHLILGVRKPAGLVGTQIYSLDRARLADGSNVYRAQLGGVPAADATTSATSGTLELMRNGLTTIAIADGKRVALFQAAAGPRLEVTLSSALNGCDSLDGGTCTYSPLWISMRLKQGTLVNQP